MLNAQDTCVASLATEEPSDLNVNPDIALGQPEYGDEDSCEYTFKFQVGAGAGAGAGVGAGVSVGVGAGVSVAGSGSFGVLLRYD